MKNIRGVVLFALLPLVQVVSATLDHSNLGWTLSLNAVQTNMHCNANERKAIHAALLKAVKFPQRRLRTSAKVLYNDACDSVCEESSDCFIAHAECLDSQRHLMSHNVELPHINSSILRSEAILSDISHPRFINIPKKTVLTEEMREKCQAAKDQIIQTLQSDLAGKLDDSCQLLLRSRIEISCFLLSKST